MSNILYLATNKNNGKRYIGVTSRLLKRRMSEHKCHAYKRTNEGYFYKAIRKHSFNSFEFKIFSSHNSKEDMFAAEIEYIATNRPEYNCTFGGEGRIGGQMSEQGKDKIRQTHAGNKYRLGKTHTDDVKLALKEHGEKNIHIFKQYMALGPKKTSKMVICLDDWMIFPSASEAARRYNVSKSAIIELCNGQNYRKKVGGFKFSYYEAQ